MARRSPRYLWIDHYEKCDCSEEALRESDLTGYCKVHDHDVQERIKLPLSLMPPGTAEANRLTLWNGPMHSSELDDTARLPEWDE